MKDAILLDSGPLGLLANPNHTANPRACRRWAASLVSAKRRLIVPQLAYYEVRRELLLASLADALSILEVVVSWLEFLPVSDAAWRMAAELWADARRRGVPTADRHALDGDVLLAAQALALGVPAVVATANVGHLSRHCPAAAWETILPEA